MCMHVIARTYVCVFVRGFSVYLSWCACGCFLQFPQQAGGLCMSEVWAVLPLYSLAMSGSTGRQEHQINDQTMLGTN